MTDPDEQLAALHVRCARAETRVERLVKVLEAVDAWVGLDGDGISDPVRLEVKAALAASEVPA